MNLNEKSVMELKSLAYDCLAVIQQQQENLRLINLEISKKSQIPDIPPPPIETPEEK